MTAIAVLGQDRSHLPEVIDLLWHHRALTGLGRRATRPLGRSSISGNLIMLRDQRQKARTEGQESDPQR